MFSLLVTTVINTPNASNVDSMYTFTRQSNRSLHHHLNTILINININFNNLSTTGKHVQYMLVLLWLFVLFEYSSSFQANTRVLASKKKFYLHKVLKWFFKSNFFLLLEYSRHEYILDCYSSTRVPTLVHAVLSERSRLLWYNLDSWWPLIVKSDEPKEEDVIKINSLSLTLVYCRRALKLTLCYT